MKSIGTHRLISCLLTAMSLCFVWQANASKLDSLALNSTKSGWNFGVLPCISYDADLGFQYGALANVYDYGDGTDYPNYRHSFYVEASYTTMRNGVFRFYYDSPALLKGHFVSFDVSYLPDAMCEFFGFNGYQTVYNADWVNSSLTASEGYRSRLYYRLKRNLLRITADINGQISGAWKWTAGLGLHWYEISDCDLSVLNRHRRNPYPEDGGSLYSQFANLGLIKANEAQGGWHPYARAGIEYDTRDQIACPTRGIYADLFLTYTGAFGKQAEYNTLRVNFDFRQYVTFVPQYLIFVYRVSTQNVLWGKMPFYACNMHNVTRLKRTAYDAMGGVSSLRGVMRNRILSPGFAFANIELRSVLYRFDLLKQHFYVGLNPFFDIGIVTQTQRMDIESASAALVAKGINPDEYFNQNGKDIYRPHMSAGVGIKAAMNENFCVSIEWAAPIDRRDNSSLANIYFNLGYLF